MKALPVALLLLAGGVAPAQETAPTVTGIVMLNGEPLKRKPMKIACPDCAPLYPQGMPREDLVVGEAGAIRGAFVYVKSGLEGKTFRVPEEPAVLEMKGCRYEPHVLGVRVGQKIRLLNQDPHNHCVHGLAFVCGGFNVCLTPGLEIEKTLGKAEVMVRLKDDIYPWMSGWIGVVDHPFFAVTGPEGKFTLKGLPPGKYTIEVWQERCAPASREIEIGGQDPPAMEFRLDLRKD